MAQKFYKFPFSVQFYISCFACYLSMVMTGMIMYWPSPLIEWYTTEHSKIPMTDEEVSWLVSITSVSSGLASVPFSMLADRYGRKRILLSTGIISIISWLMIMFTGSKWVLYFAQLLGGLVAGGAPSVAPVYISEICPPKMRGTYVGHLNTMYFVGQLMVYIVGPKVIFTNYIAICSSLTMLFFVTFMNAPESPYFLLKKGNVKEAEETMLRLRGKDSVKELEDIKDDQPNKDLLSELSLWQALRKKDYLKHMICLQILSCVNQFQGLAVLSMYVMELMGGEWEAMEMGIVFLVTSFFAAYLADPFGRRPLLITSLIGSAIFTSCITVYFINGERYLMYLGIFGFSFISCVGINPFTMTLPSELFPTRLRALANGLTQLTAGFSGFLSLKMFVNINRMLDIKANFIICSVWSLVGIVASLFLPETANSVIGSD